jgi:hypothetical protein
MGFLEALQESRILRRSTFVLVCILLFGLIASSAEAAVRHQYEASVSERLSEGVPAGAVGLGPEAVTGPISGANSMDAAAGELWVAEKIEGTKSTRVDQFETATGTFGKQLEQSPMLSLTDQGVAVGAFSGEGSVFVGANHNGFSAVGVYGRATGGLRSIWLGGHTPNGSFVTSGGTQVAELGGVAVDNSIGDWAAGDVYVDTYARETTEFPAYNVVDVLRPQANSAEPTAVEAQITGTCSTQGVSCPGHSIPFTHPFAIAVSGVTGDVYVADSQLDGSSQVDPLIDVFEPTVLGEYRFVGQITATPNGSFEELVAISVDDHTGEIYIVEQRGGGRVVDQFTPTFKFQGELTSTPNGLFTGVNSTAVDPSSGQVFVGEAAGAARSNTGLINAFGPDLVVPDVQVVEPVSEVGPTQAKLHGEVNPVGAGEANCEFEIGTTREYGLKAACTAPVADGSAASPVEATATGLESDTRYFYRLDAGNHNGVNTGIGPEDEGEFTTSGPGVHEEFVVGITSTSATMGAAIDPNGSETTYFFEYGLSTEYGHEVPLAPGEAIGKGSGDVKVTQNLQGLIPGTEYHFRVVAVSALASGSFELKGPDHTFSTDSAGGSETLLDGRSWEQVSPVQKNGALIEPISAEGAAIQAAADGSGFSYVASAPTQSEVAGYTNLVQIVSTRGHLKAGWSSQDLTVPHAEVTGESVGEGQEYRYFSTDLANVIMQPIGTFNPNLTPDASEQTPLIRQVYASGSAETPCTASCFTPIVTRKEGVADVPPGPPFGGEVGGKCLHAFCGPEFEGATGDLSYVAISSPVQLTEMKTQAPGERGLYLWHKGAPLEAVSVLPVSEGGHLVTGTLGSLGSHSIRRGAISEDGSRVIWSRGGHLYLRDRSKGETLRLDVPEGEFGPSGGEGAILQGAATDDSRVFFSDGQRLTSDAGALGSEDPDLYECAITQVSGKLGCDLKDLTPRVASQPAFLQGAMLGASQDGERVYFVANGALTSDAKVGSCGTSASNPRCNLYEIDGGVPRLVAVLAQGDERDWSATLEGNLPHLTASVSTDGDWVTFMSERSLTGYDNDDAKSGVADEEVFSFDAGTGKLHCVSCAPSGARPVGVEVGETARLTTGAKVWPPNSWLAANVPGWTPYTLSVSAYQSRYLDSDGRVFFNSNDALVPSDINGTWDVYEWEPAGIGTCDVSSDHFSPRSDGCVGLVSSGQATGESAFLDASETGADVFFMTSGRLVRSDTDTAPDVYDAHECSVAVPCSPEPAEPPPVCVSVDACRAAQTPQPSIFGSPPSATFAGEGNVTPVETKSAGKPSKVGSAQKLTNALKTCRRKPRAKRAACERAARRRFPKAAARERAHAKTKKKEPKR